MEFCNFIRSIFSWRFASASILLFTSSMTQASYIAVVKTYQDCFMVGSGESFKLTCTPRHVVEYVYVPDAPPQTSINGGASGATYTPALPPPKCDVIAAENDLANQKCSRDALNSKAGVSAYCGSLPAVAYKDIGVGVDIGKIVTATINGKVQEEYHPQESCYRGASDSYEVRMADCKVKESERELAAVKLGCK